MTTRLCLIRHGQAFVNVEPIIGGMRGDRGLTPLGVSQAELLRDRLVASRELRPDVFITSTLPRARQTAEIIAPAFGVVSLELDDDVQELRSSAEADGLDLTTYRERYGWFSLKKEPLRPINPGGESWAAFVLRTATALSRIVETHRGKSIVIVCHGGVVDASFIHFFGMNGLAFPQASFHTENTSLTRWKRSEVGGRDRWRLLGYNDVAHLRSLGHEPSAEGIDYEDPPESGML